MRWSIGHEGKAEVPEGLLVVVVAAGALPDGVAAVAGGGGVDVEPGFGQAELVYGFGEGLPEQLPGPRALEGAAGLAVSAAQPRREPVPGRGRVCGSGRGAVRLPSGRRCPWPRAP